MAIVIKEICVNTVVEKKVVQTTEISTEVYRKIKEEILRELSVRELSAIPEKRKNER